MYHYVYRITNIVNFKHYYGVRSSKCNPNEDLGIKYFSSSSDKLFIFDQKQNPSDYKYKVIKTFANRSDAIKMEIKLHKRFNVSINESFYNISNQTSEKFDNHKVNFKKIAQIQKEKGSYEKRSIKCKQTWKNKSEEEMEFYSLKLKKSFSKIDLTKRANLGVQTKRKIICDNGNTLLKNTIEKTKNTCIKNGWYDELSILQSKKQNEIMEDGRTRAQHRREKQYIKQKETINEDGLNMAQVAANKYHENLKNTVDLETGLSKAELRIKRQKETIKKNGTHKGEKNSSFGTTWLYNTELKKKQESKRRK